jgi:hypothetical protein
MNQRDADPTALVGQAVDSRALPGGAIEGPTRRENEERDREESLDYEPIPLRKRQAVLVRFRQGGRLQPLPYSLDDEDA